MHDKLSYTHMSFGPEHPDLLAHTQSHISMRPQTPCMMRGIARSHQYAPTYAVKLLCFSLTNRISFRLCEHTSQIVKERTLESGQALGHGINRCLTLPVGLLRTPLSIRHATKQIHLSISIGS